MATKTIQNTLRATLLANGWLDVTAQARTGRYVTMKLPQELSWPTLLHSVHAGSCILLGKSGAVRLTPDGTLARSFSIQGRIVLAHILATPLPGIQSARQKIEDLF